MSRAALDGTLPLVERLAEQDRTYARGRRPASARPAVRQVTIDNATSERASIIEVRTPIELGSCSESPRHWPRAISTSSQHSPIPSDTKSSTRSTCARPTVKSSATRRESMRSASS